MSSAVCDGGPSGRNCRSTPIWRMADAELVERMKESPHYDRVWSYSCGNHVSWLMGEICGGSTELLALVVERIRVVE